MMDKKGSKVTQDIIHLFRTVGRASLLYDIQNSHSGNMAVKFWDENGEARIAVTATGSQKGDLEPGQICFLSPTETDYGYYKYKASSETDIHARILDIEAVEASIHAHTKELMIVTLDDLEKPSRPPPFIPIDPLGYYHLQGEVPVDWVAVPSGSPEMIKIIPERLTHHPAALIQSHGIFAKGRTLQEAFFLVCIANNAGYIIRLCQRLGVDVDCLRKKIQADPDSNFAYTPPSYTVDDDESCDFPQETEIIREFFKAGARVFESRLSPFHTGTMSVRSVNSMLYVPKASMPRDIGGPLLKIPMKIKKGDSNEVRMHKAIYRESNFQTIMHCYIPEAEALAHFTCPGEIEPASRIVPIDAEGSFLYPVIPIIPPKIEVQELIRLLHDYKTVIVRGGGVWATGQQSLSPVLHHPSSVRDICLYQIGAFERGLDLREMEPKKAKRW